MFNSFILNRSPVPSEIQNENLSVSIKYLENNYTSLNNQISNYIIEEFMDDFVCELYSLINSNDFNSDSDY